MAMDHVAELARQAVNNDDLMHALRNDPARITKPLNLSEPQLRALISAGSFSTARPALTTSQPAQSLASQIAAMDVGTLFPPEGQGQFPTPGELPPIVVTPRSVPGAAHSPAAAPHGTSPAPASGQSPHSSAPQASAPQTGRTPGSTSPQSNQTPQSPMSTPGVVNSPGPGRGSGSGPGTSQAGGTPSPGTGQGSGQKSGSSLSQSAGQNNQNQSAKYAGTNSAGCCEACSTAMISLVAELSTTAQAAMTAIAAIAGLG